MKKTLVGICTFTASGAPNALGDVCNEFIVRPISFMIDWLDDGGAELTLFDRPWYRKIVALRASGRLVRFKGTMTIDRVQLESGEACELLAEAVLPKPPMSSKFTKPWER